MLIGDISSSRGHTTGVPWLSWRSGAFLLVTQAAHGFRSEHLYCDRIHPNFVGHRYGVCGATLCTY